jgi:hypothetical protein
MKTQSYWRNRMTDLLPCPFCGGNSEIVKLVNHFKARCSNYCYVEMIHTEEKYVIQKWNTRASESKDKQ